VAFRLLGALDPVAGQRMGPGPFGNGARLVPAARPAHILLVPPERSEHVAGGPGIVAGGGEVADTESVRLIFLVARVTQGEIFGGPAGDPGEVLGPGDRAHRPHTEAPPQRPPLLPAIVGGDDVADLVRQHRSELVLRVDDAHQAAGDVDVAAGHGEGVDDVAVDEGEGAFPLEARRGGDLVADAPRIIGLLGPVGAAELGEQLRMLLAPDLLLSGPDLRLVIAAAAAAGEQEEAGEREKKGAKHRHRLRRECADRSERAGSPSRFPRPAARPSRSSAGLQAFHRQIAVGVDADVGRDRHRLAGDRLRVRLIVE
jgi:hypothetical protein